VLIPVVNSNRTCGPTVHTSILLTHPNSSNGSIECFGKQ